MRKPANMMTIPQGGWHCRFPDGFEVRSQHPSDFLRQCYEHLEGNGGDTGSGWRERVWELVCDTHPEMECLDSETPLRIVGPDDVRRFLMTMWETWKSGAESVSEEVQNTRIDTCLRCPKKGYSSCAGGCSQLGKLLADFVLDRKIPRLVEVHKQACMACGCHIETKTRFPVDVLRKVDEKLGQTPEYWQECWMLSEA